MVRQTDKKDYHMAFLISLTILMAVCLGWLVIRSKLEPRLAVSDVDIGTYIPGQIVERAIRLENKGWRSLTIHEANVCCGTSLPDGFPKRIAPQSTNSIVVRMRTPRGYNALEKKITLKTNDPKNHVSIIAISGKPDISITVNPPSVDLEYVVAGRKVANAVTFLIPDNKQPTFSFITSSPNIQISSPHSIPARRFGNREYNMFVMDVSVDKETPRGLLQEYIFVKTGITRRPYVVVPVKGMVERGLRVRPKQVFFGMVAGKSIVNRVIRLEVIGPGWDSVKIETPGFPGITAKVQQKDENEFRLHVSLDPAQMSVKLKSHITLHGYNGDTIQIPVLAIRKPLERGN